MKILYSILTVAVLGGAFFFLPEKPTASTDIEECIEVKEDVVAVKPQPKEEMIAQKAKDKKPVITKSSEKIYNIKEKQIFKDSFEYADVDEMKTKMKPKPRVEPMGAYTFKKSSIKELFIGDSLVLPEINDYVYTIKAETRKVNSNGSVTVKANIEGQDGEYYAIMTEGEKTSFITLNTSEGVFELETLNGNGYIYSAKDMNNNMIDHTKTDAILPPRTNH